MQIVVSVSSNYFSAPQAHSHSHPFEITQLSLGMRCTRYGVEIVKRDREKPIPPPIIIISKVKPLKNIFTPFPSSFGIARQVYHTLLTYRQPCLLSLHKILGSRALPMPLSVFVTIYHFTPLVVRQLQVCFTTPTRAVSFHRCLVPVSDYQLLLTVIGLQLLNQVLDLHATSFR
jgi:hypothetical protein